MRRLNIIHHLLIPVLLLFCINKPALAQSLPVGSPALEDYYRRAQLSGKMDSAVSFSIRPINFASLLYSDSTNGNDLLRLRTEWRSLDKKGKIQLLPADFRLKLNTHHPNGWNDGAMIPAKGLQTMFSAGVYAEYGPLTIQLKPEMVLARNDAFEGFPDDHYEVIWARYYDQYNYIDLPERFGTGSYSKIHWGQSSIRLNFDPVSVGLSSENLWWGPGKRNSLLMSNTAAGFNHFTFNTSRPVKTPLGSIEGQFIAGRLEGSGFDPLTPGREYFGSPLTLKKPDDWRYLSGLAFTWQPKWVPGLFLGINRVAQVYAEDMKDIGDYLPLFGNHSKVEVDDNAGQSDQFSSLFFRWVWFEEQAEIYFEYGKNNHLKTRRNSILEPENSRAYLFGLTKLFELKGRPNENVEINVEVTELQQTSADAVLNAESWYVSKNIPHGYTHRGEVLGAGIGPGGNLQTIDISWNKGIRRVGLQLERYVHNNDFFYYAYVDSKDFRRHWIDLSVAGKAEWAYKNFLFHGRVQATQSLNYQWFLLQLENEEYFIKGRDRFNLNVGLGFTYRF